MKYYLTYLNINAKKIMPLCFMTQTLMAITGAQDVTNVEQAAV